MNIGLSTACFYPIPTEKTIELLAATTVDRCEVFLETISEYDYDFCAPLKEKLNENNMKVISCHGLSALYEPMIFADYPRRSRDCIAMFKGHARATAQLGGKYVTFHGNRRDFSTADFDFARFAGVMDELCRIAADNGVILTWENVSWCQSSDPAFIAKSLEYIKEDIRFTFDIKQARRAGVEPEKYLKVMGPKLANFHINDFDDTHICLLPGQGTNDFQGIVGMLEKHCDYKGDCIIEVYGTNYKNHSEIKDSVEFLRTVLPNI